jgi:cell division transport system ATP-binding protein
LIQLFHVFKYFDRRPALFDVNLEIRKGEFVVLMGPSGAGKTTLLKLLFLAERPDEGQILVNHRNIARLGASQVPALRQKMGLVFQDFRLLPKKTVFDNVALPLVIQGMAVSEIKRKVAEVLKAVGLDHKRESRPGMLSAGEQQRACIARAIVNSPIILLADEPTGNLDPELASEIIDLFKTINARGTTVMIATHNRDVMQQVSQRVVSLHQGRLTGDSRSVT